jgi:MFS family permease
MQSAASEISQILVIDPHANTKRVYRRVSARVVVPLLIAYIVAYLDRVNVGFAKLQMLRQLHFSEVVYGLGAGIFFIGYFLFGIPSNILLHRLGARRALAGMMVCWSFVSAGTALVTTPAAFYALRFLLGITEAGFFPGVIFYLTLWYPADRRAQVTALFMTGIAICGAVGSPLSGWIMQASDGYSGLAGWQWLLMLEALPAVSVGIYLWLHLTDSVKQARWLNETERALIAALQQTDLGGEPQPTFRGAFGNHRVVFYSVIYFCLMSGLYGVSFWLPSILAETGVHSPLQVGLLATIPYTVAAAGMISVGRSADGRVDRRWHVVIPAALGALGLMACGAFLQEIVLSMVALTVATFGILTAPPLFWSVATASFRGKAAATSIAIINSVGCLAGFMCPYLVGWIKDLTGSTHGGMNLVAGLVFLGAFLVGFSRTEASSACIPPAS